MPKNIAKIEEIRDEVYRRVAESQQKDERISLDELYEDLRKEFGNGTVGRTTVGKILKKARDDLKQHVPPDPMWDPSPLAWAPEAYPFLLAINRHCVLGVDRSHIDMMFTTKSSQLTDREAQWGAVLFATLKDAPIRVAYNIVRTFADRETVSKVYERSMPISDLIGYLEYRPWESKQAAETYHMACSLNRVPRVRLGSLLAALDYEEAGELKGVGIDFKEIAEIEAVELSERVAQLDGLLSVPVRQTRRELQHIAERAAMIQQTAVDRINAILDSRSDQELSEAIHAQEVAGNDLTHHQEGQEQLPLS